MHTALGALGDDFESIAAIGGRTSYGPERHDGVAVQADLVHDSRCADDGTNCWRYGGTLPMP